MMRREPASTDGPRRVGSPPHSLPGCQLWLHLVRPALLIAVLGGVAVLHLLACARLSVIECDKQRLRRIAADGTGRRAELRRELSQRCNAQLIRQHADDRGLEKPVKVVQITVDKVPKPLWAEMPKDGSQERDGAARLGQLSDEAATASRPVGPPSRALQ